VFLEEMSNNHKAIFNTFPKRKPDLYIVLKNGPETKDGFIAPAKIQKYQKEAFGLSNDIHSN